MVFNFHHSFCTAEQPRDAAMLRFQIGRALRGEAGAQQNTAIEVKKATGQVDYLRKSLWHAIRSSLAVPSGCDNGCEVRSFDR